MSITLFWFRRDLRLTDNAGLYRALSEVDSNGKVQPLFIFDENILGKLNNSKDKRMPFLWDAVQALKTQLEAQGSDLIVRVGRPFDIIKELIAEIDVKKIYTNHDYEPSAIERDQKIQKLCGDMEVSFQTFKDQVIFEKNEVLTDAQKPYTVFTPYKRKWISSLSPFYLKSYPTEKYFKNLISVKKKSPLVTLKDLGFERTLKIYPPPTWDKTLLKNYGRDRDFPAVPGTSHLGLHLRFGTVSVRELVREAKKTSEVWLSELIWREFFMQILFHFPHVVKGSFRPEYDKVEWRKASSEFKLWCEGMTGYPMVDAGMRELNATGFMHNRTRMVTASFLTKHLLMHWSLGERYFAKQLLDYDLSANNGNWQWAAGTGCDAAPYFRIFNPEAQMERFDPDLEYIKRWVPEFGTDKYPSPMIDHKIARDRALRAFAKALGKKTEKQ